MNAVNVRLAEVVVPGREVTVDECMSRWLGRAGKEGGMPFLTVEERCK